MARWPEIADWARLQALRQVAGRCRQRSQCANRRRVVDSRWVAAPPLPRRLGLAQCLGAWWRPRSDQPADEGIRGLDCAAQPGQRTPLGE
jgi:hypothetical protein